MNLYNYEDIKAVHLEITEKCQARCPMCDRNQNGGADNPNLGLHELTVSDVQKISLR
jgi:MoaA/NifB/PqqE/SkfB family radical SAM enzyme